MNAVIYASRGGNTEKVAEFIARGTRVSAQSVSNITNMKSVDIMFIGGSIYAGKIDRGLRNFLQGLTSTKVKEAAVFGTSAGKKTAFFEVKSILEAKGIKVIPDEFHCKGSFLLANVNRPYTDDLKKAEEFARRICGRKL